VLPKRVQARREEPQGATRPLEGVHGRPPLLHQVDQRRVEGVRGLQPLPKPNALLRCLLPCRRRLGMRTPHPGDDVLVGLGDLGRRRSVRSPPEQALVQDRQDLVTCYRLPKLIHARRQLVDLGQEGDVPQRLARAPRERIDQGGVGTAGDLDRQILEEVLRLPLEGRVKHRHRRRPLHVLQDLVKQHQHRAPIRSPREDLTDHVPARGHPVPIMALDERECFVRIDLPRDPAPHRLDRPTALERLPVPGIELLAVEDGDRNPPRIGEVPGLRDLVERPPVTRGMEEGGQRV